GPEFGDLVEILVGDRHHVLIVVGVDRNQLLPVVLIKSHCRHHTVIGAAFSRVAAAEFEMAYRDGGGPGGGLHKGNVGEVERGGAGRGASARRTANSPASSPLLLNGIV